jgi:MFS family permease
VLLAVVTFLLGHMRSVTVGESVGWALFLLALAVFIRGQRRAATPVAAWPLFRSRSFAAATADVLLVHLAMYTALLMIPFLVSDLLHVGAGTSGLLLGIMAGFMGLASPIGGHVSDRFGRRQAALLGGVLVLAAAALLSTALLAGVTVVELGLLLAMFGAGVGISTGAANTAAIESAPRALAGTAAGTSSMMRYVGSIVGTGILAAALGSSSTQSPSETFVLLGLVVTLTAAGAVAAAGFMHGQPPAENTIT